MLCHNWNPGKRHQTSCAISDFYMELKHKKASDLSVEANEFPRVTVSPRRQHDVLELGARLFHSDLESVLVHEEVGQIVELWNQFANIGHVVS